MTEEQLLTMRDIAEREGVTVRTVKRWRAEGKLPAPTVRTTIGGARRLTWRPEQLPEQREFDLGI